jgi:hypothetical protein
VAASLNANAKRAVKAIDALYKTGLLIGPRTADRFEVSNAIEVLLPLEKLTELLTWLRRQNNAGEAPEPDESSVTPGADENES